MSLPSTTLASTQESRRSLFVLPAAAIAAVICGVLAGAQPVLLAVPLLMVIPVILWKRPEFAIVTLLVGSTVIENFVYTVGTHKGAFTDNLPWWRSVTHGMIIFPVEIFLLIAILVWALKAAVDSSFRLPKSPVFQCLKVFWAVLLVAVGVGMSHGAHLKYNFWELRSWIYLTVGILLAAAFIRKRSALDLILWTFVLGSGFKGLQGSYIFFSYARAMHPRPEAILGHEEAFFFGVFIVITAALWLYQFRGPLRTTATCLLPFVVIADLANARRTAWLILGVGLLTLAAIGIVTLPHRRKALLRTLAVVLVLSSVYLPAYWNHDGTLAQPARAVRSQIQPDSRDASSDLYRNQENLNLINDIKGSGMLGTGFGIQIEYNSQITNISDIDPMIAFIPHNGVLWVWLRTGLQGEVVFWCLVGIALIRACELARVRDRRLAMMGTITACAIIGYAIDGYEDMGFAEFRIALAMGCLIGLVEAAIHMAGQSAKSDELPVMAELATEGR